jgi:hypothetical protein
MESNLVSKTQPIRNIEEITVKGKETYASTVTINNFQIIVMGNILRTASLKEEWFEDITGVDHIVEELKQCKPKADIFTFWQRLPNIDPQYSYYMESESITAMKITSYKDWWENQISSETRNKIRKAEKKGISVKVVDFSDDLVRGIMSIFNETPVRRGKPFWHYGKNFATVKKEWSRDLNRCDFIGAFLGAQLVGYIKLVYGNNNAQQVQNLSMIKYRNKYVNNALMAKAIERCHEKGIQYVTYGGWRGVSHSQYLMRHGFSRVEIPRYYVPLTLKGEILLGLRLHKGIKGIVPNTLKNILLKMREKWYSMIYSKTGGGE